MLLQRSPVIRYIAEIEFSLLPRMQHIWTLVIGAVTVGAYNSVTAASGDVQFRSGNDDITGVVGEEMRFVVDIEGPGVHRPNTWVVDGTLPAGVNFAVTSSLGLVTFSGTPTESGSFPIEVQAWRGSNMSGAQGADLNFTVVVDSFINQQPLDAVSDFGGSPVFTVSVGDPTGVTFQWQKQNMSNPDLFDDLPDQTSAQLALVNVSLDEAGNYRAVVTKGELLATSDIAMLTVNSLFSQQPTDQAADWNENAEFSVAVTDTEGVTFQWQKQNAENPELFDDLPGQTVATLNLSNVLSKDVGSYQVIATKGNVMEVSAVAVLSVNATPLQAWLDTYFEDPLDAATALDLDPDMDGLINGVEFTFGLNPNGMEKDALGKTSVEEIDGEPYCVIAFPPVSEGVESTIFLETNTRPDATGWVARTHGVDGIIIESSSEGYYVKVPASVRSFIRLRIVSN